MSYSSNDVSCQLISNCIDIGMRYAQFLRLFTLQNDLQHIQYQDSLCVFRAYVDYVSCALFSYSFLVQAIYRCRSIVYSHHLLCQSAKLQAGIICLTWIFSLTYPFAFLFTDEIVYNIDNQICQLVLRLSFSIIYGASCIYIIPVFFVILIYFKSVRCVHEMDKRTIPVNTLARAKRESKMVQHIVILLTMLITIGIPYGIFVFISFFTNPQNIISELLLYSLIYHWYLK
jgi:hypothetical protein